MNKITKTIPLKEASIFSKKRIESALLNSENYIGTDNLLQNKKGKNVANYVPSSGSVSRYDKGDILISNIRPYLKKIWHADSTGGNSADVLALVVNKEFDSKFVYYSIFRDEFFDYMMAGSKGTKMPRGDKKQVMDFPIPEFNFEDQQKISSVLSALDVKIEINKKINKELELMIDDLYNYWFVQFDFPNKNGKPYRSSGGEMVWNDELKRNIPRGWASANLLNNSFAKIIKPGINKFEGLKKYLATADINERELEIGNDVNFENRESRANMQPIKNSLWFAKMKASKKHLFIGEFAEDIIENSILSTGFMGLKCEDIAFEFLAGFISSDIFEVTKDKISHGATMQGIGNDDLKFIKIIIPDEKTLSAYGSLTRDLYKKMDIHRQENKRLAELRDWLLPMLMNGQVKVI